MLRSTRLGIASASLIASGLVAGWAAASVIPSISSDSLEFAALEGHATTGLLVGLLCVFIGSSLATGVGSPRPRRCRRARTAKQYRRSAPDQRGPGTPLVRDRGREATLQAALPEPLQMRSRVGYQHSEQAGGRPSPHPSVQSHLLGVCRMPATPTPRPAKPAVDQISNVMDGQGRETPHGPVRLRLVLTMVYRPAYPYDVNIVIAPQRRPGCGHDPARWAVSRGPWCASCDVNLSPWLVSREVLCNAAMWETPAGMGDFRAAPMAETTTQLVFIDGNPGHSAEPLYVDVQRLSLLSFLERTMRLVKPGRESKHVDVDQLVAALLGSDTR